MNSSFSSLTADASYGLGSAVTEGGLLSQIYNGMNFVTVTISLFLVLVAYDQCEPPLRQLPIEHHG